MLILYFSGTGNTKYIAEGLARINKEQSQCYSIEEKVNFDKLISCNSTVVFCYPIYGSCVPEIMREFVIKHKSLLNGKDIMIFCTQVMFSGDGARVFTELLEGITFNIIYAEHFNMPNNICNLFVLPVKSREKARKHFSRADTKIYKVNKNIENSIVKRRGFNMFSKYLGLWGQRFFFSRVEKRAKKNIKISAACNGCGKCVSLCPKNNLEFVNDHIQHKGQCTLCYRCVNICPQKAITVMLHSQVRRQYYVQ